MLPLTDHFNDPDTSGVRLTTILGNIDLALYDQRTPITVANFKNYIDSGRYFETIRRPTSPSRASFIARCPASSFRAAAFSEQSIQPILSTSCRPRW